jgi:hypothetical protein
MLDNIQAIQAAKDLINGLTTDEVRSLAIEALRRWRRASPGRNDFSMHGDLGRALVPLLAERKGVTVDAQMIEAVKEPFLSEQGQPWMQEVVEFISWLVGARLVFPLYHQSGYPLRYRLTQAGIRLLDSNDDHPVLPGFLERLQKRCLGLVDEVMVHLIDARDCLDHGLARPAVALIGVAYECAEDEVIEHLESEGKLVIPKNAKTAVKIAAVRNAIPVLFPDLEKRGAALAAWDFADRLRDRRNQASHPRALYDFGDISEVHELLLSAGRHLPGLWSVKSK